jgi:mxaK protein
MRERRHDMAAGVHKWLSDAGAVKALASQALLLGALVAVAVSGWLLISKLRENSTIGRLAAGTEVAVDPTTAAPAVLEARAAFLLRRGRIDDAQPLLDQASERASPPIYVRMLYNMANARMRAAVTAIEKGNFDKAIPLVALAKSEYRSALRLDPVNWNAKYNLDVAMRLVRDLPQAVGEDEEKPLETPEKLWTDLPGVPKGLP